ncbi:MAG: hypothetical protein HQ507_05215 [Candidatus Marinimicrobia bacterium]|nr:hypothetical protein [Candidatus Neomarinimicrobiota bacterium]
MLKHKLFVPASTFLSGLILWIIFLLLPTTNTGGFNWIGILFCLGVAGLFTYSAIRCRRATGGRTGNRVRAGVLSFMAIITFFKIGFYTAVILAFAAVIIGIMAFNGTDFTKNTP